jgi:hypothetical protein
MTVRDLLTKAFKFTHILGANEPMADDEASDALDVMNGVIEQANITKLLAYYQTSVIFNTVNAQITYTIGPASTTPNVTAPRPVEIMNGFSRRSNIDQPIFVGSREDYDRIQLKTAGVAGWGQAVYYEATWPKGTLYFYPAPQDSLTEVHLAVMAEIPVYATLDDVVTLPPAYSIWLQYKTGKRLAPEYGLPFTSTMKELLDEVEGALKNNNVKPMAIATSGLGALSSAASKYNILADGSRR